MPSAARNDLALTLGADPGQPVKNFVAIRGVEKSFRFLPNRICTFRRSKLPSDPVLQRYLDGHSI